jgi:2-polyprenyl-3-methyl-5-hydroxy-6-metoxy-1,4-benzoquinol methylase
MLRHSFDESWPKLWRDTYEWDQMELWGSRRDLGYSYQYRSRHQGVIDAALKLTPPRGLILDLAGASGNFTLPLAEHGYRVTWNDLRSELVDVVKHKYEFGDVEFCPGNVFELTDYWVERFDSVVAAEVIEHMAHPDEFLAATEKILKPGGHLFLSTPNGKYFRFHYPRFSECSDPSAFESVQFKPDSDGHIFLLDVDECRMLAELAGLEVVNIEILTNPLTRGHVKLGHLLPLLPESLMWSIESTTRKLPRPVREKIHCQMIAVLRKPLK